MTECATLPNHGDPNPSNHSDSKTKNHGYCFDNDALIRVRGTERLLFSRPRCARALACSKMVVVFVVQHPSEAAKTKKNEGEMDPPATHGHLRELVIVHKAPAYIHFFFAHRAKIPNLR